MTKASRLAEIEKKDFGSFWFLAGCSIHGLWKRKRYTEIKNLAMELPKLAWDNQQKDKKYLIARVKRLEDVLDKLGKAVVMGKREDIIYACQKAKEALSEGE